MIEFHTSFFFYICEFANSRDREPKKKIIKKKINSRNVTRYSGYLNANGFESQPSSISKLSAIIDSLVSTNDP